ncbi:anti-sigma factor family protein [Streptomyces bacillaris]|uniref:anti-sigma factor family protein n=1 Tax=Streptomyces bacillaris TaxID=68179 RepID=UPI0037F4347D
MECEQEKTELTVYAMDALDAEAADRVGSHVRGCPDCAAEVDEALATLSAVRLLPEEEVVGNWAGRLPELREAAVRAALAERAAEEPPPMPSERASSEQAPSERTSSERAVVVTSPTGAGSGAGSRAGAGAGAEAAVGASVEAGVGVRAGAGAGDRDGVGTVLPADRPRHRRWRPGWALAAAVAGVALGYGASLALPAGTPADSTAAARPAGTSVVRATGADGIAASLEPRPTGWGTEVRLELSGVDGPRRCVLVAVAGDGTEETALTWQVPEGGYGLPGSPKERLLAVGGVGMAADDIAGYVIRTTGGERLLDLPAARSGGPS